MQTVLSRANTLGWIAMALTISLWVSFALSTRAIAFSNLTTLDVATIRFTTPVLLLAPWIPRALRNIRQTPVGATLLIAIGAGLPFYLLSAVGGALSSATYVGVINPGMPPLYIAMIASVCWQQRYENRAILGYGAIVVGIAVMVLASPGSLGGFGAIILLMAAFFWALYTIGLQQSGLDPVSATLLVCVPSSAIAILIEIMNDSALQFHTAPIDQIAGFMLIQGIGTGIVSSIAYTTAIRRLGANTTATFGALSPVLVAIVAIPLFGEHISLGEGLGVILVVVGITLINLRRQQISTPTFAASAGD